ncbi:MAG: hypothetical protein ABI990_11200 [Actinomycetota bacterium]
MHDGEPHSAAPLTWLAVAFVAASSTAIVQIGSDARWLAAIGAIIARARAIPHAVAYAAVPSDGWHDAPALGQLAFHGLESLFGDKGLVLAQIAAVMVAVAVLALDLRRADARDGAAAGVLLAVVAAAPATFFVVRAELFSLALFPVLVLLLRSESRFASKRIWLVVPLVALWANLHGGVLIGLGVLGAYLTFRRARSAPLESACVLAASFLALLATPALLGGVAYYADVLRSGAVSQRYGLWGPLSLHKPLDLLFVVIAVPLVVAAVRRRPAAWELVLLVALAVMSVEARRNGIWLLLFAATPAARSFGAWRAPLVSRRLAIACCAAPLLIAGVGLSRPVAPGGAGAPLLQRALAAANGSPILADPLDAEQVALHGGRILIGNPIEAFPREHQRLYVDWLRGLPAGDVILRAPIRIVIVERGSEPQKRLAADSAFRELARDELAVLYAART